MATARMSPDAHFGEEPDPFPWQTIIDSIEDRTLTPFLGAGISSPPLPGAHDLAEKLADAKAYPFKVKDLMEVAQYAATLADPSAPKRFVRKLFEQIEDPLFGHANQPHTILASLPIRVYLTTNYDLFMEKALEKRKRTPRSEICRWNSGLKQSQRPGAAR